jgi:tetratricopeptide (TPR) repeat protein
MMVIRSLIAFQVKTRRLKEAEELLRRVAERKIQAADNEVAWARRSLALLLANGTDFKRFQEALRLVQLDLDANGRLIFPVERITGTENIRTLARVLATQQQKQFRDRAIEFLEELQRFQALLPEDHYVLALLYDARGSAAQSLDQLRSLVLSHPEIPQYQAQYTSTLIRERHADAEAQLGRLLELEKKQGATPGAYGTVDLRVRLLEVQDQKDRALELVKEYIGRKGASKDEMLLLVTTLARQKRYPEAFAQLAEAWQICSRAEAVGAVSVALLRGMKPTDEECRRVEAWLKEASDKNPRVMALHMHLADLYDQRGRYPEAEEQYRILLRPENEPNNVVALNNLAWLLAHKTGEGDEALERINTAVSGMGRQADLLDTRGVVYLALGRTEEALADFREATAEAASPARLFHLARAHLKARDNASARKALGQALTRGLKAENLHPVEQAMCRQVLQELQMQ